MRQGATGHDRARGARWGATVRDGAQWGAAGRDRPWKNSIVHGSLFLMNCDKQNQKFDQLHSVWIYKKHCKMSTSPCFLFFQVFQLVLFLNCFLLVLRKSDSKKRKWLFNHKKMSLKLKFDINNCLESFSASFTQKFVPKMVKNHLGHHESISSLQSLN